MVMLSLKVQKKVHNSSSTSINGYDWASHYVSEFCISFSNKPILRDWIENSCILRILNHSSCVRLSAYRGNERVFHGKDDSVTDFFFAYSCMFYDMYVRLPFSVFQVDVLRMLNVAPSQLHPNNWGCIQAFATLCQVLAIRLTPTIFLYFFQTRPVVGKG